MEIKKPIWGVLRLRNWIGIIRVLASSYLHYGVVPTLFWKKKTDEGVLTYFNFKRNQIRLLWLALDRGLYIVQSLLPRVI